MLLYWKYKRIFKYAIVINCATNYKELHLAM